MSTFYVFLHKIIRSMQFVGKAPGPLKSHICYCLRWSQRVWSCLAVRSNSVILHYTLHFWPALSSEITTASQTNHQGHTGNCSSPRFQIPKARILIKSLSWSHFLADCRRAQLKAISCFHWGQLVEIWSERGNLILARLISCPVLHHPRFGLRRAMWSQENKSSPSCDAQTPEPALRYRLSAHPHRSSFMFETDPTIQGVPNWWDITSNAGHSMTPGEYNILKLTMKNDQTFVMTDTFQPVFHTSFEMFEKILLRDFDINCLQWTRRTEIVLTEWRGSLLWAALKTNIRMAF